MPNRLLLGLSERPSVKRYLTRHRLTRSVVERFVAGESIDEAVAAAVALKATSAEAILDYLGENVTNDVQADAAAATYFEILDRIGRESPTTHISVKLTQLGLDRSFDGCLERMEKLCAKAAEISTVVAIDMEAHEYTDRTIETFKRLRESHDNLVLCLQAYLRRTPADVAALLPLRPRIRLCKGAYNEPASISLRRSETRQSFLAILRALLSASPQTAVATHDDLLVRSAIRMARELGVPIEAYEFQLLYGVRRDLQKALVREGLGVRIYVPFGDQWYPYLMRRMAERPANLRLFVEALLRG